MTRGGSERGWRCRCAELRYAICSLACSMEPYGLVSQQQGKSKPTPQKKPKLFDAAEPECGASRNAFEHFGSSRRRGVGGEQRIQSSIIAISKLLVDSALSACGLCRSEARTLPIHSYQLRCRSQPRARAHPVVSHENGRAGLKDVIDFSPYIELHMRHEKQDNGGLEYDPRRDNTPLDKLRKGRDAHPGCRWDAMNGWWFVGLEAEACATFQPPPATDDVALRPSLIVKVQTSARPWSAALSMFEAPPRRLHPRPAM